MKFSLLLIFGVLFFIRSNAQDRSGRIFLHWGYNRSAYTSSDIHFTGDNYNFTIHDAKATDRQTDFDTKIYFNPKLFTIPQYVYRVGYFINDRGSLSLGMDHMKYVLEVPGSANITGHIDKTASLNYAGTYDNTKLELKDDFVLFEHSDGLNYLSIEVDYNYPLLTFGNDQFSLDIAPAVGIGVYIPKTKVSVFDQVLDNKFHLAGYGISGHGLAKLYYRNSIYLVVGIKSGWAFLPDVLVDGSTARVHHNFGWVQTYAAIGGSFRLGRKVE